MHKPSDDPDKILDIALATYADPVESLDPSMLAERIITIAQTRKPARLWRWGLPAAVVLAGVLIFAVIPERPIKISSTSFRSQSMQASKIAPQQRHHPVTHIARRALYSSRTDAGRHGPPKLDQFPMPEPLSEQEKLLVLFMNTTSTATQLAVAQASEPPRPIKIAALMVPPIDLNTMEIQTLGEHDEEHH
jgi:hypothetical protein